MHVFGHAERGDDLQFLMQEAEACRLGQGGGAEAEGRAVQRHLARIGGVEPGEDADQGAFPGPVFAHQGMHLAAAQGEGGAVQRARRTEGFHETRKAQFRHGAGEGKGGAGTALPGPVSPARWRW